MLLGIVVGLVAINAVNTFFIRTQSYFHSNEIKRDIIQARMMIATNANCKATMKDATGADRVDCVNKDGSLLTLYRADNLNTPLMPYDRFGFGKVGKVSIKAVCSGGHAIFSYAVINPKTGAPIADPAIYATASASPQWLDLFAKNYFGLKPFDVIPCP